MTVKELEAKRNYLNTEMKKEIERCKAVFSEYYNMEGKYGRKVYDNNADPHCRPYYFQYAEGMREKEEAEREAFLTANNYRNEYKIRAEFTSQINAISEEICQLKYGMSRAEKRLRGQLATLEKERTKLDEEIEHTKQCLTMIKKED